MRMPGYVPTPHEAIRIDQRRTSRAFHRGIEHALQLQQDQLRRLWEVHDGHQAFLARWETRQSAVLVAPSPPARPRRSAVLEVGTSTVLVVDDDPLQRGVAGLLLGHQGYRVLTAEHGAAALALIAQAPPDLILLDMDMPVMDGPTFAQAYAALPPPHAPIIVVSADPLTAYPWPAPGPLLVLGKPVDPPELLALVAGVLVG